jgi:biotin operon repressor
MSHQRMRQLRRTLAVLLTLTDGQFHGLDELASAAGYSTRSIRRDVDALDEIGFAIDRECRDVGSPPARRAHYRLVNTRPARQVAAALEHQIDAGSEARL